MQLGHQGTQLFALASGKRPHMPWRDRAGQLEDPPNISLGCKISSRARERDREEREKMDEEGWEAWEAWKAGKWVSAMQF